jgi:hypothetical protein
MAPDSRDFASKTRFLPSTAASCLAETSRLDVPVLSGGFVSGETDFGFCWFPVYFYIYIYINSGLNCSPVLLVTLLIAQFDTILKCCTITSVALTVHAQFSLVIQLLRVSAIFS